MILPLSVKEVENVLMSGLQKVSKVSLDGLFSDEDGETLSIWADRGDAVCVAVSIVDGQLNISPMAYGAATVTITATDFLGETAELSFKVAVTDPRQPVRVSPEVASTETYVSVETSEPVMVKLSLYASTGGLVYKTETEASAFDPVRLDVSALAPGRYTAVMEYNGSSHSVRVIKY